MDKKVFGRAVSEVEGYYRCGQLQAALKVLDQLLTKYPNDLNILSYASGVWIDIGSAQGDILLVDRGIQTIENFYQSESVPKKALPHLLFNLSNGYGARYILAGQNGQPNEAQEALQRQKSLLQVLLLEHKGIPDSLLSLVMTNYANLLDHLGRTVEAVDQYYDCLKLTPDHAVAMGNCGNALRNLFNVDPRHNPGILYETWRLLTMANQRPQKLQQLAGYHVLEHYQQSLKQTEALAEELIPSGLTGLKEWAVARERAHQGWKPIEPLIRMCEDRLLLTVNPCPRYCPQDLRDDAFFHQLVVPHENNRDKRFTDLTHTLNQMKEDFATARYLYYHSQSDDATVSKISGVTDYAEVYDYAEFNLRSGFLKASFRVAADCLDKIAAFLNTYFDLGHPEDRIYFGNVWYSKLNRREGVHPTLQNKLESHQFLRALFDLNRDWSSKAYLGQLKQLRNATTHRRLVLYWMGGRQTPKSTLLSISTSFGRLPSCYCV